MKTPLSYTSEFRLLSVKDIGEKRVSLNSFESTHLVFVNLQIGIEGVLFYHLTIVSSSKLTYSKKENSSKLTFKLFSNTSVFRSQLFQNINKVNSWKEKNPLLQLYPCL
jgi:hypothetical protein